MSAAYGRPAKADCCALRILDAATICMALVICAVFFTDLMRRRMSRVLGILVCFQIVSAILYVKTDLPFGRGRFWWIDQFPYCRNNLSEGTVVSRHPLF